MLDEVDLGFLLGLTWGCEKSVVDVLAPMEPQREAMGRKLEWLPESIVVV